MPEPVTGGIAAATLLGGIGSSIIGAGAQKEAAGIQASAARAGIAEQRRQFEEMTRILQPYIQQGQQALGQIQPYIGAGQQALGAQQALLGLQGPRAQEAAYQQIESSPAFQAMVEQGERAILQNAAATGGLRGGNTQGLLAQYRPQLLNQLAEQQYGRLAQLGGQGLGAAGQLASLGTGSAGSLAQGAGQTGQNIAGLLGQQGAAQAGGALAQGGMWQNLLGLPGQTLGIIGGAQQMQNLTSAIQGLGSAGGYIPAPPGTVGNRGGF